MVRNRIALLLLLVTPGPALASEVSLTEDYTYFSVFPDSVGDLSPALVAAATRRGLAEATIAETLSRHDWVLDMVSNARACWVEGATVNLEITYRLPKLVSQDAEVKAAWEKLYPRILEHEYRHKDIALEASEQILAELSSLPSARDCDALAENANTVVARLHAEERARQKAFDAQTRDDGTEGVIRFEIPR